MTFLTRRLGAVLLILVAACSSSGGSDPGPSTSVMPVAWECPSEYEVKEGLNTDFPHNGLKRAFVVYPARNAVGPAPVWVPLTGSVESTNDNLTVPRSGANSLLADKGYMVIGPVRACANQDPNVRGQGCNGSGSNGWNWNPWFEGRAAAASGDRWKTDEGPDSSPPEGYSCRVGPFVGLY